MRRVSAAFNEMLELDHAELCKENVYLRALQERQEKEYMYVNHIITRLRDDYAEAKDLSVFLRCRALREMVEKAIAYDQLSRVQRLAEKHSDQIPNEELVKRWSLNSQRSSGHGDTELEEVRERWKAAGALSPAQLKNDNRRRWHHIEMNRKRFQHAFEALEGLQDDFNASKRLWWWGRLSRLKAMIKKVTRDDLLQV